MNLFHIVDTALKNEQPFFAVAHVDDVHHPYNAAAGKSVPEFRSGGDLSRYDRGIALFDQGLRVLIEKLKVEGLWENTVLIVTADHGEEFAEHGGTIHSRTCYDEVTHVPLLLRIPGAGASRIASRVALLDLVPTLLELLDRRDSAAHLDGQSLLIPVYEPYAVDPNRPLFCTIYQLLSGRPRFFLRSVRRGSWSYFEETYAGSRELYDQNVDPYERVNVARSASNAPVVAELRQLFLQVSEDNLYQVSEGRD